MMKARKRREGVTVDWDRITLQIEEPDSVGNSISFGPSHQAKTLQIEVDNPWSGDSESGFGRTAHITLTKEHALLLAEFLLHFANQP